LAGGKVSVAIRYDRRV